MKVSLSGIGEFFLLLLLIGSLPLFIVLKHHAAPLREQIDALEQVVAEKDLLISRQTTVILDLSEKIARIRSAQRDHEVQ